MLKIKTERTNKDTQRYKRGRKKYEKSRNKKETNTGGGHKKYERHLYTVVGASH